VDTSAELEVASDVERQLERLRVVSPILSELPIAPLHGLADLVRLELALRRFAEIHRSKQSKALIRAIGTILRAARCALRDGAPAASFGSGAHQTPLRDTQPAA
jgi:hypothetical protein